MEGVSREGREGGEGTDKWITGFVDYWIIGAQPEGVEIILIVILFVIVIVVLFFCHRGTEITEKAGFWFRY
jgi:hypothetical protein